MKYVQTAFLAAIVTALAGSASAAVITFDEVPAMNSGLTLAGLYGTSGATFSDPNAGTWGGNSQGNPGSWDLQGTNGPQFLGFNGFNSGSYSELVSFATGVSSFSADFSRSLGSSDGLITLEAFDGALMVASTSSALGAIDSWTTLTVSASDITSIEWIGTGTNFHPYGVDNLVFSPLALASSIPEPVTLSLFGAGLAGAVAMRRRKTRAA